MSMLNRFKETFKKLYERRKEVIEYWNKTPTTKIIMINAGVYVQTLIFSVCGN